MFNLASKEVRVRTTTGELLAPNTYVICNPKTRKQNCAPFLSSSIRESPGLIIKQATEAIYDTRTFRRNIKGGGSLRNTAPRFVYKDDDLPGPAQYEAKPIRFCKRKLRLDPTKPKLFMCHMPYSCTIVAPSIPTKINENGYEIDEEGNIHQLPPDPCKPNDITIQSQFEESKGWGWSRSTSSRFRKQENETPGPANYQVKLPKCLKFEEEERFREMARRFSFLPRFIEAQELKATREAQPGPGSYNLQGPKKMESKSINPRPFIRQTPRFSEVICDHPAPTAYNICDCYRNKKDFSMKCVCFGVEASRFKQKSTLPTPGPASYDIKGPLQEKLDKKRNWYSSWEPPFNCTASRVIDFVGKEAQSRPSAADYPELKEESDEDDEEKCENQSSVFANVVRRFYSVADKKDYIGPARYKDLESYVSTQNRKSFTVSELPFNSSGVRSCTPIIKYGVPCPTSYEKPGSLNCKGFHFALSPRFKQLEETPGPGLYNIHPSQESATYKASQTHNLRLKENIVHKKLRQAPKETRRTWLKMMKKRKLLKAFDVELNFEDRMVLLIQKVFEKPV